MVSEKVRCVVACNYIGPMNQVTYACIRNTQSMFSFLTDVIKDEHQRGETALLDVDKGPDSEKITVVIATERLNSENCLIPKIKINSGNGTFPKNYIAQWPGCRIMPTHQLRTPLGISCCFRHQVASSNVYKEQNKDPNKEQIKVTKHTGQYRHVFSINRLTSSERHYNHKIVRLYSIHH